MYFDIIFSFLFVVSFLCRASSALHGNFNLNDSAFLPNERLNKLFPYCRKCTLTLLFFCFFF